MAYWMNVENAVVELFLVLQWKTGKEKVGQM